VEVIWRRDLHEMPTGQSIVLREDSIVVAERRNRLVRLHAASGELAWEARVLASTGWLAVAGDCCAWLSQHSVLQCFDLASGEPRWQRTLDGIQGYLVAIDDVVVVGGWRGYEDVTALRATTGEVLWTRPARGPGIRMPAATRAGLAISHVGSRVIELVRPEDGTCVARIEAPAALAVPDASPSFDVAADALYAIDGRRALIELQLEPVGGRRTVIEHDCEIATLLPTVRRSRVFFVDVEGWLCAYDLRGDELWRARVDHDRPDVLPLGLSLVDDVVYVGTSRGLLAAYESDGRRIFRERVGKRITAGIAVAGDRIVFATANAVVAVSTHTALRGGAA
jgi:outer membrane protein assembly factor BamB